MPVAKVKVKDRHKTVAAHFRKWKSEHPDASREEQIKTFDFLADTAKMDEISK